MGDLHPKYHRNVIRAIGVEAPHQLIFRLLEQHLVLHPRQKIVDVNGENELVLILAREH